MIAVAEAPSLLARIGGRRALDRIVESLYRGVLSDPELAPAFAGLDTERLKAHQRRFLAQVFGGGDAPEPGVLRRVHARVVAEHALEDRHFDAVLRHLGHAVRDFGIDPALADEILRVARGTRREVLDR